ncbi:hypothetical protein J2129_000454 [Methanofollis sp. W23]|uniref:hypothetical protein n=1 Tax=Methanofollis sp. W23 TaxID=2817849 RepID=UPI001AE97AD4|nr:hypothetical protein [Methanofollis sp. W23]MBP2145000.1 hypothetical protein [Methanofollis sp. W23]
MGLQYQYSRKKIVIKRPTPKIGIQTKERINQAYSFSEIFPSLFPVKEGMKNQTAKMAIAIGIRETRS